MGRMLNWVDFLLVQSQRDLQARRPERVVHLLGRLAPSSDLAIAVKIQLLERIGEAYLMLGDWARARKSFRLALRCGGSNGRLYGLLARALASDPTVDAQKAGRYYRRALQLEPNSPAWHCEAGMYFAEMGKWKLSIRCLQRAVDLAPDDLGVLATLVHVLCQAERFDEAHKAVRVSRFRHRGKFHLEKLRDEIEYSHHQCRQRSSTRSDPKRVLPFLRLVDVEEIRVRQKYWRRDRSDRIRPHIDARQFLSDQGRSG